VHGPAEVTREGSQKCLKSLRGKRSGTRYYFVISSNEYKQTLDSCPMRDRFSVDREIRSVVQGKGALLPFCSAMPYILFQSKGDHLLFIQLFEVSRHQLYISITEEHVIIRLLCNKRGNSCCAVACLFFFLLSMGLRNPRRTHAFGRQLLRAEGHHSEVSG
jgi:hypothetical protein